ncbi:MAG: hypothetical protein HY063_04140 [Bacteroidetes bacterium]|nr:hypothetical protein [Bacteroidota bacterium]
MPSLTPTEKKALIEFHSSELKKMLRGIERTKNRISKLGGKASESEGKPKRVRRTQAQIAAAKHTPKRRAHRKAAHSVSTGKRPHIKWVEFVPHTIKQHGKPMTAREILTRASKKFSIPTGRKEYKSLAQTLRNMRRAKRITAESGQGNKKYYKVLA